MAPRSPLSINALQHLVSQILHDLITHFTSFSLGVDHITSLQDPMWQTVHKAKNQMYEQINLVRYLFMSGMGVGKDAQALLHSYVAGINIEIKGTIDQHPRMTCGLAWWLSKQIYGSKTGQIVIQKNCLSIHADHVRQDVGNEDTILETGQPSANPREGVAWYVFHLASLADQSLSVHRQDRQLSIHWKQKTIT